MQAIEVLAKYYEEKAAEEAAKANSTEELLGEIKDLLSTIIPSDGSEEDEDDGENKENESGE